MHIGSIGTTLANPRLRQYIEAALARRGAPGDSLLAHITPREAWLLHLLGGAGSINPRTGLRQFTPAPGTPAAGAVPTAPVLGGYSLAPLMSGAASGNLIGNAYGSVPSWATAPFQIGLAPHYANPNWPFATGGLFQAPGQPIQPPAPVSPPPTPAGPAAGKRPANFLKDGRVSGH